MFLGIEVSKFRLERTDATLEGETVFARGSGEISSDEGVALRDGELGCELAGLGDARGFAIQVDLALELRRGALVLIELGE